MRNFGGRGRGALLDSGPMKRNNQNENATRACADGLHPETEHPATEPICGFGRDRMPYRSVMEHMARTPVYSVRTSSLPLAQLLRPSAELNALLDWIETVCDAEGPFPEPFERYLEYPVWPRDPETGRIVGKPSMSDAMLLGKHMRIAVEGKWTEPHFGPYQTVEEWLDEAGTDAAARVRRERVLDAWLAEVAGAGALRRGVTRGALADVPYQLVHRTASACHGAGPARQVMPVLCYVVFRDPAAPPEDAATTKRFEDSILGPWTEWLRLDVIEALILRVPVVRTPPDRLPAAAARLFPAIGAGLDPYGFDWNGITLSRASDKRCDDTARHPGKRHAPIVHRI